MLEVACVVLYRYRGLRDARSIGVLGAAEDAEELDEEADAFQAQEQSRKGGSMRY